MTAIGAFVAVPLLTLIIAALAFLILTAWKGPLATFRKTFAVVAHASVIPAVGEIVETPVKYFKQSLDSSLNVSILMPMLSTDSYLARLLGYGDLFRIWWVIVLAIGLAVLYRLQLRSTTAALLLAYAALAALGASLWGPH
jgi:hypothetical protein